MYPQLHQSSDNDSENTNDNQDDKNIVPNDANDNEAKRKKKKKKRKKTENIKNQQQQDVEYNKNIDEIEQSIWEVNQLLGEPVPGCSKQSSEPQWINEISKEDILTVEHKHLNPYNELKKIFGSKTIQAERRYNCIIIYHCIFCNLLKDAILSFCHLHACKFIHSIVYR